jgi:hypothetical protein
MSSLLSETVLNRGRVNIVTRADALADRVVGPSGRHSALTSSTTMQIASSIILLYLGLFIFTTFEDFRAYILGLVMVLYASWGMWLVFFLVYWSYIPRGLERTDEDHSFRTGCVLFISSFLPVIGLVYVVWRFFTDEIQLSLQNLTSVNPDSTVDALVIVIISIVAWFGSTRLSLLLLQLREREQEQWRLMSKAGLVLATSAFITAFLLTAVNHKPPLPTVEIDEAVNIEGRLIGHTDGFWYVFARENNRDWELIATPDSEVETVRIHPNDQ